MQTISREQRDYHHGLNKVNRETGISSPSNTACTTSSSTLATFANPGIKTFKTLSCQSTFRQGCKGRIFLVDRKFKALQWKVPYFASNRLLHINRCINQRVVGHMSTDINMSQEEQKAHINILELKAVHLAILTFTKFQIVQTIHVQMDNKIALSYLVKMGGTHNKDLLVLSIQIWNYLQSKKITITAKYLPGHLNVTADWESRNFQDKSDWKLSPEVFAKICQKLGTPSIDLFASRMCHQLPVYMAWKRDPGSQASNAIYQPWTKMFPYAFPPFSLITRVLLKVRKEGNTMILVAPTWQSQAWYSVLLSMCIHNPFLLPHRKDLLLDALGRPHPLLVNQTLRLAAWLIFGNHWHQKAFQTKLQSLYQTPEEEVRSLLTNRPGASGLAGVVNGRLIPFNEL